MTTIPTPEQAAEFRALIIEQDFNELAALVNEAMRSGLNMVYWTGYSEEAISRVAREMHDVGWGGLRIDHIAQTFSWGE